MKIDPVCKMEVSEKTDYTTLHGVKKIFFCSNECRTKFIHEPEKYMENKPAEEGKKAA